MPGKASYASLAHIITHTTRIVTAKINNSLVSYNTIDDGRIASSLAEKGILDMIESRLNTKYPHIEIYRPPPRHWFDIRIGNIAINLKVTNGGCDNVFNKVGITRTLVGTNQDPNKKLSSFSDWYDYIRQHWKPNYLRNPFEEYHFLVIHKSSNCVLFKSILDINTYHSNPSNILQINWNHEFKYHEKTINTTEYLAKKIELLKCIQTSLIKENQRKRRFIDADIEEDLTSNIPIKKGKTVTSFSS